MSMWKVKQFFRKLMPFFLIGGLLYGGYTLHKEGAMRRGIVPAMSSALRKMPVFGSTFRRFTGAGRSYSHSGRPSRRHKRNRRRSRRRR